jgi:hypothetical protein
VVERIEMLYVELLLESCSDMQEKLRSRGSEDDVVNVEQQVSSAGAVMVDEHRGVQLGLHEVQRDQIRGEAVVASLRRLLQAIEGLIEPAHQPRMSGVNKADGLGAINHLGEGVMEEKRI